MKIKESNRFLFLHSKNRSARFFDWNERNANKNVVVSSNRFEERLLQLDQKILCVVHKQLMTCKL